MNRSETDCEVFPLRESGGKMGALSGGRKISSIKSSRLLAAKAARDGTERVEISRSRTPGQFRVIWNRWQAQRGTKEAKERNVTRLCRCHRKSALLSRARARARARSSCGRPTGNGLGIATIPSEESQRANKTDSERRSAARRSFLPHRA